MEPQLPSPNISPEMPRQPERANSSQVERNPSAQVENGERFETRELQPSGPTDSASQALPVPPILPQLQQVSPTPVVQSTQDDNPMVAADEDLIEKEWVEKAKRVIAQTRHDPFLQEQAVSELQADYLQKRYNKSVKIPRDAA